MKKYFLLFLLFSIYSFAQKKEYNFKYVYYVLTNKTTGQEQVFPTGTDAVVIYDTFYKSYETVWTDSKNFRGGNKFEYLRDEEEMKLVQEETSKELYRAYHLESKNIFVLAPIKLNKGMIVLIWFTNFKRE